MLHRAKWHVHGCYVDAPCDLARQLATSISSRFWPSAQLLGGLVVSLSAACFSAAMPSRKRKLSATASSASSNATGARSEASSANRAHLGSRDERGSAQPEDNPEEDVRQGSIRAASQVGRKRRRVSCAASASSNATGARSEASSANRAHLGSRDERGSAQPEDNPEEDVRQGSIRAASQVRVSCAASASSNATGARSEASSADRTHLGSGDEQGSTQPEDNLGEDIGHGYIRAAALAAEGFSRTDIVLFTGCSQITVGKQMQALFLAASGHSKTSIVVLTKLSKGTVAKLMRRALIAISHNVLRRQEMIIFGNTETSAQTLASQITA
jgi:hypothetical protein